MEIFIENNKVKFTQGVQTFTIDYEGNEEELKWISGQLDAAFKNFMHEVKIEAINEYTENTIQHLIATNMTATVCLDCESDMITQITPLKDSCQSGGSIWETGR